MAGAPHGAFKPLPPGAHSQRRDSAPFADGRQVAPPGRPVDLEREGGLARCGGGQPPDGRTPALAGGVVQSMTKPTVTLRTRPVGPIRRSVTR